MTATVSRPSWISFVFKERESFAFILQKTTATALCFMELSSDMIQRRYQHIFITFHLSFACKIDEFQAQFPTVMAAGYCTNIAFFRHTHKSALRNPFVKKYTHALKSDHLGPGPPSCQQQIQFFCFHDQYFPRSIPFYKEIWISFFQQ